MSRLVLREVLGVCNFEVTGPTVPRAGRVAFVASYSEKAEITKSLATLVGELELGGYLVILIRGSSSTAPLKWPVGVSNNATIVRKPNLGYDFGSWATGMALFPDLVKESKVLLLNDSLVGPFGTLKPMLDEFEGADCDVWGVTNSAAFAPHLQSYVLGFKDGILGEKALRDFWSRIMILDDKDEIIDRYEIGLGRLLAEEAMVCRAWFDSSVLVEGDLNPSVWGWRRLLALGFPFVKRQLITIPTLIPDGVEVPETVRRIFGVDTNDWG